MRPAAHILWQKFYIRGIKLIWTHRKRVNEIEARLKAGGEPMTRWETRFIETYKIDAKKYVPRPLPPFPRLTLPQVNSILVDPRSHRGDHPPRCTLRTVHAPIDVCSPIPARTYPTQTTRESTSVFRIHEG